MKESYKALRAFLKALAATDPPPPPITRPAWILEKAEEVEAAEVRGHRYFVFELVNPDNGITGYVLDATGGEVVPVRGGDVERAIDDVGRWANE